MLLRSIHCDITCEAASGKLHWTPWEWQLKRANNSVTLKKQLWSPSLREGLTPWLALPSCSSYCEVCRDAEAFDHTDTGHVAGESENRSIQKLLITQGTCMAGHPAVSWLRLWETGQLVPRPANACWLDTHTSLTAAQSICPTSVHGVVTHAFPEDRDYLMYLCMFQDLEYCLGQSK